MNEAENDSGINLFGFQIKRKTEKALPSFVAERSDDATAVVSNSAFGSYAVDFDPSNIKNEIELVQKYRDIALVADLDMAIDEIVNEIVVYDDQKESISVDFTEDFVKKYSQKTRDLIEEEFKNILAMMDFSKSGQEIIRKWYIEGKAAFHKVIDEKNPKKGILEMRPIDSIKIKKVVEIKKEKDPTGIELIKSQEEYFVFSERGFTGVSNFSGTNGTTNGIKISKDAIAWVTSGLVDYNTTMNISYLHKAIRPLNQLKMMEDSTVIYKLVRAPQRRVFYIDTSGMARTKAEQYVKDVMARYKNKQVYDASTGELKDQKNHMSILEDFWMPRTNGGKGTEITTLDGSSGFDDMTSVNYFQNKLYQALNIPVSRLQAGQPFNIGRSNEISRDEIKFSKFINKLRRRWNIIFLDALKTQLTLKGIATLEDWEVIKEHLKFNYLQDNFYAELKESEIFKERIANAQQADPFVGKYFSPKYVQKNLLKFTQAEIDDMDKEIEEYNASLPPPEEGQPGQEPPQAPQDNSANQFR